MADICPVCNRSISFITKETVEGIDMHFACAFEFNQNPEKYGGKAIEKTDDQIKAEVQREEQQQEQEEKALYKSVRIKGGVDINSFDMPFGDMVIFMVKWALASIPAFIILFSIFGIFFAIFGSLFF
jgi:flagellar motor protein MotB